jgi:hypothetical protein
MESKEPVRIMLPPRMGLIRTAGQLNRYATLPIEASENSGGALNEALGLLVVLIALGFSVVSRENHNLFSSGIALAISLGFGVVIFRAIKSWRNIVRTGPASIRISQSGVAQSKLIAGELPWSEIDALYPKFAYGRIEAIELKLKSRAFLLNNYHEGKMPDPRDKIFITINLRHYPDQNKLGETIVAASNHIGETRSAWTGVPPGL